MFNRKTVETIFKSIDKSPKFLPAKPEIYLKDNKFIDINENLVEYASHYLNNDFKLSAFESRIHPSISIISMKRDFDKNKFYMSEEVFISNGNITRYVEANLENVDTDVIYLKICSSRKIRNLHLIIENGEEIYRYFLKYSDKECQKDIGELVRNSVGWRFYPCRKDFI